MLPEGAASQEEKSDLLDTVMRLPLALRQVILLTYYENMSPGDGSPNPSNLPRQLLPQAEQGPGDAQNQRRKVVFQCMRMPSARPCGSADG